MLFLEATARRANRTYPSEPWSSPWLQSQFLGRGTSQCSPRKGLAKEDSYKCLWGRFKTLPLELEMAQWITMGTALARDESLVSNTLIGKLTITLNSSSRWPDTLFLPSFKYTCTHVPHTHITLLRNNKIWEKKKRICIWIIQMSSSCDPDCDVYRFNALFWQTNPSTLYKRESPKYGHGPVWNKMKLLLNIKVLFFSVCLNSLPFYFSFQLLSNLPPKTAVEINLLLCKNNRWWLKVFLIPGKFSYE